VTARDAGPPDVGEVRRVRPGLYSVIREGRSYEVVVDMEEREGEVSGQASVDGRYVPIHIEDRRRTLVAAGAGRAAATRGAATVVAPMPGRIVAVPVAVGESVERGQTVVVLEAMKMESVITAPAAGTVKEVLVSPGQPVQQRQALVRIE
jgi:biotin carboxyl carrier protein